MEHALPLIGERLGNDMGVSRFPYLGGRDERGCNLQHFAHQLVRRNIVPRDELLGPHCPSCDGILLLVPGQFVSHSLRKDKSVGAR